MKEETFSKIIQRCVENVLRVKLYVVVVVMMVVEKLLLLIPSLKLGDAFCLG